MRSNFELKKRNLAGFFRFLRRNWFRKVFVLIPFKSYSGKSVFDL